MSVPDPVLAADVQTGPPTTETDEEIDPGEQEGAIRFALTSEAGFNDGLAFPFTTLAVAIAGAGLTQSVVGEWLLVDVGYRIAVGIVVGYIVGRLMARFLFGKAASPVMRASTVSSDDRGGQGTDHDGGRLTEDLPPAREYPTAMEFATFADHAGAIEAESANLDILALVTDLFERADDDLPILARFVQGRVFPAHDSTTLDIGPTLCYTAIARAAGQNVSAADVEARLAEVGEIGEVAAGYDLGGQQGLGAFTGGGSDSLTVSEVDAQLRRLAAVEGDGSQDTKVDLLFDLFNRATPEEARYLARLVLSEMRIGVGTGTVRDAIGEAFDVPVDTVERALQVSNDYGLVASVAREDEESGLGEMGLAIGRPVQAMLAQAGTVSDALDDWDRAAVSWKFDGARIQVHYDGETVSLFSRNMEDVTQALPEVVEFVESNLSVPAILDGEAIAVGDDGDPLPFQEILRRFRRKHDVAKAREEIAVEVELFDCLHADGDDLLDRPLTARHDRLTDVLETGVAGLWLTDDIDEIADIDAEALAAGHEGIMLKDPDSTYSPGRRGRNWLKRKPDVETLDLVVTGAEWGEGRRAEFLGTFQVSVRADDGFEPIGKVATGITDEELAEVTELLEPHILAEDGQTVEIDPAVVFEVGYEEIQQSPTYGSGWALRFPRFLGVRSDKAPSDADSRARVERLADGQ